MTVSVASLVTRASTILQDMDGVRWTVSELLDWGSEGQVELVKLRPDAYTKTVTVRLVPGAKQSTPAGSIEFIDVRQNTNGIAITPCDRAALDRFSPKWMVTPTASYVKHWMDDPEPDTFYVYPAQNATPGSIVVTHAAVPPALSQGGTLAVRDIYAENVVNYIIYRALSKDAEFSGSAERAAAYYQLFKG